LKSSSSLLATPAPLRSAGDLAAAIYATIEGRVETVFGDSISAIDEHSAGVHLTFERGQAREFDVVIGADGLHSNVRRLLFGPQPQFERYLGCRVATWVVDGYRPRDELVYVTHSHPGRSVARFSLRGDRTLFLLCSARTIHTTSAMRRRARHYCGGSSLTWAGNVRRSSPPSTMSTIGISMSSARSGWIVGRGDEWR
jgi:2-polyprenyl-6-methoxyphenol hydroxylase-like FAD-dependent oxidoreductase